MPNTIQSYTFKTKPTYYICVGLYWIVIKGKWVRLLINFTLKLQKFLNVKSKQLAVCLILRRNNLGWQKSIWYIILTIIYWPYIVAHLTLQTARLFWILINRIIIKKTITFFSISDIILLQWYVGMTGEIWPRVASRYV